MAVKHVTIYECDRCKVQVGEKDLRTLKITGARPVNADLCAHCVEQVRDVLQSVPETDGEETCDVTHCRGCGRLAFDCSCTGPTCTGLTCTGPTCAGLTCTGNDHA